MSNNYFDNSEKIDQWLTERRSRFTASENYKLLVSNGENIFGTGAKTYIETKVIELTTSIWQRPEMDNVEGLLHGKLYEYPAYERYVKETKNYSMSYFGTDSPLFIKHPKLEDESGGTPDVANLGCEDPVLTHTSFINYLAEIKCSINPAYHFRRLKWKSQFDIKENYILCYTQMQNLMLITGASGCDFISYDERQLAKSKQIVIIEVKPDQKFIDNLELRIQLAVKAKYKLLSEHMGTELKNRTDYLNFVKGFKEYI